MRSNPTSEATPGSDVDYIFQNAWGIPDELDEAPTTANNILRYHGDSGRYGTDLYINLNGTTYKFTGVAV